MTIPVVDPSTDDDHPTGAPPIQARTRILDASLALMGEHGSAGVSMRQVASAAAVNVATIYHYFPSKADLLRAVIEERRYGERLSTDRPPVDLGAPPAARLVELLAWLWARTLEEESVFRLIVGEAIRGEAAATASIHGLVEVLTTTFEAWVLDALPERQDQAADLASVLRDEVFSMIVEHLALGGVTVADARRRAGALARLALA